MKKRVFRFAAPAAIAWASSGSMLLGAACGGRTVPEAGSGAETSAGTSSGVGGSGFTGSSGNSGSSGSSGSNVTSGLAGSSSGVTSGTAGFTGTTGSFTGSTGATGSFTGSTGGVSGGSGSPYVAPLPPLSSVVLDDMRNVESPTLGYWYTYSDRVIPFSEPPIIQTNLPGTIRPSEGSTFAPTAATDPRAPIITVHGIAQTWPFREVAGQGNDVWGAGFGLDLTDAHPSPTSSVIAAINACPNSLGISPLYDAMSDPNATVPVPLNAQFDGYTGIAFYAISFTGASVTVSVQLDDQRTNGWGGICDVCLDGGRCGVAVDGGADCPCSDSFQYDVLVNAAWNLVEVHFANASLRTQNWSGQNLAAGSILSSALYDLHFQLMTAEGLPLPAYDVGIAYVTWLKD
jgi:hypothetical protein